MVTWECGGLSLWSVFGAHLICTLGEDFMWVKAQMRPCYIHTACSFVMIFVCLLPLDIDLMVPRKTPLKSALWYVDICFKSEKIKIKVFICDRGENFFLYAESCTLPLSRAGVQKATTYGCSLTNRRGEDKRSRSRMWRWLHLLTPALCRLAYCSSTSLRAPSQSTPARWEDARCWWKHHRTHAPCPAFMLGLLLSWLLQSNQEQVLLHGEDRLYLTCGDPTQIHSNSDTHPHTHLHPRDGSPLHPPPNPDSSLSQGLSTLLGHKHWHVVQVRMCFLLLLCKLPVCHYQE